MFKSQTTRSRSATLLNILGYVSLFVFAQPSYEHKYLGNENQSFTNAHFGLPTSPWLSYESRRQGESDLQRKLQWELQSWSWPFLLASLLFFWLASQCRPSSPLPKGQTACRLVVESSEAPLLRRMARLERRALASGIQHRLLLMATCT